MNYLIPANTKKSQLIFGLFNKFDMILFGSGIGVSLILLMALPVEDLKFAIISVIPGLVTGFLVFPLPYYHNVLNVLIEMYEFMTHTQTYVWKGWCFRSGNKNVKKRQ